LFVKIKNNEVKSMKSMKGFTLVELLVAVLIIGILAAIALPQYNLAVAKSKFSQLYLINKNIVDAQDIYFLINGEYATDIKTLDIEFPGIQGCTYSGSFYRCPGGLSVAININFSKEFTSVFYTNMTNTFTVRQFLRNKKKYCTARKASDFANKVCKALGGTLDTSVSFTDADNSYLIP
jgi:type IV pilus assembly protein PilE